MGLFLLLLQALALITAPVEGSTVVGTVNITGTAASPGFDHYELAFAYDPNPTDNWFEIVPPSNIPVTDGLLGAWDTTAITDGVYMLRLRVYNTGSKTPVDVIVRGITVQNDSPTPTIPASAGTQPPGGTPTSAAPGQPTAPPPTAAVTAAPTAARVAPTATAAPASLPAFLNLAAYSNAFCNGAYLAGAVFLALGIYTILRDRIRRPIRKWLRRIVSDSRKP
jgi:hypothetical protein